MLRSNQPAGKISCLSLKSSTFRAGLPCPTEKAHLYQSFSFTLDRSYSEIFENGHWAIPLHDSLPDLRSPPPDRNSRATPTVGCALGFPPGRMTMNHRLLPFPTPSFGSLPCLHLFWDIPKASVKGGGRQAGREGGQTPAFSVSGGTYRSRICLPPGSGQAPSTSRVAAAVLPGSCRTDGSQGQCRSRRLGGSAHTGPALGRHRSQDHMCSRKSHLQGRTEREHEGGSPAGLVRYARPSSKQAAGNLRNTLCLNLFLKKPNWHKLLSTKKRVLNPTCQSSLNQAFQFAQGVKG